MLRKGRSMLIGVGARGRFRKTLPMVTVGAVLIVALVWLVTACGERNTEPAASATEAATSTEAAPADGGATVPGTAVPGTAAAPSAPTQPAAVISPVGAGLGTDLVFVHGGEFIMGNSGADAETDDHWPHRVAVDSFQLSSTEVTNAQFVAIFNWALEQQHITLQSTDDGTHRVTDRTSGESLFTTWSPDGSAGEIVGPQLIDGRFHIDPAFADHPVVRVTWFAAAAFCNYASAIEGLSPVFDGYLAAFDRSANGYRLPTEAEWEYAARERGTDIAYSWGDGPPQANIADRSYKSRFPQHLAWQGYNDGYVFTAPVGSFEPNALGLFDLSGNVAEWCLNWFYGYPGADNDAFLTNPAGPDTGLHKMYRGGSWFEHGINLMTTNRGFQSPNNAGSVADLGFRVARNTP